MLDWSKGAKAFEESTYNGVLFQTKSTAHVLKKVKECIDANFAQMIFLLGEPGSGKSYLLNYIHKSYQKDRKCLLVENPFVTPAELLKIMLEFVGMEVEDENNVESMRVQAIDAYKKTPHLILIDEAQLASAPLREFIRILSDTKVFWFLMAMHTKDGEQLLSKPHFSSRPHLIVYTGVLKKDEYQAYIHKSLNTDDFRMSSTLLNDKLIDKSYEYTDGNFRNFKKLFYNLFLLLAYTNANEIDGLDKPSLATLELAAIKSALLPNRKTITDFNELVQLKRVNSNKNSIEINIDKRLLVGVLALILTLVGAYALYVNVYASNASTPKEKQANKSVTNDTKKDGSSLSLYPPKVQKSVPLPQVQKVEVYRPKVKRQEPKGDIVKISKAKRQDTSTLEKKFDAKATYALAYEIATRHFEKKEYANALIWTKKANGIDAKREGAWILYAKCQDKLGNTKAAIRALSIFLQHKNSPSVSSMLKLFQKKDKK